MALISLRLTLIIFYLVITYSQKPVIQINQPNIIKWVQKNNENNSEQEHLLIVYNTKTEYFAKLGLIDKLPINYVTNNCQVIESDTLSSLYMLSGVQARYSLSYIYKINGKAKQKGVLSGNNAQTNFMKILNLSIQEKDNSVGLPLKNKIFFDYELKIYQIDSKYYAIQPKCYYLSRMTKQMVCQYHCRVKTIQNIIQNIQLPFEELEQYKISKQDNSLDYFMNSSSELSIELNENIQGLQVQNIIPINGSILCNLKIEQYDQNSYLLIFQCQNTMPNYSIARIRGFRNQTMEIFFDETLVFQRYEYLQLQFWLKKTNRNFQFLISDDLVSFRNINTKFYFANKIQQKLVSKPIIDPKISEVQQSGSSNAWIYILLVVLGSVVLSILILVCICKLFLWSYCKQRAIKFIIQTEKQEQRKSTSPDLQSSRHLQSQISDTIKNSQLTKKQKCISSASTANTLPGDPNQIDDLSENKKQGINSNQFHWNGSATNQKLKKKPNRPHFLDVENPEQGDQYANRKCQDCSIILQPQPQEGQKRQISFHLSDSLQFDRQEQGEEL